MPSVSSAGMPWLTTIRKPIFSSACRNCTATSASAPGSPRRYAARSITGNSSLVADCSMSRVIAVVMLGHLVQGGADVADGGPTEVAHPGLIEMPAAMHRAAIVPDHQVSLAPLVAVNELAAGG